MAFRIATFNAENLMQRFDFSGYRNELRRDRAMHMVKIADETQYHALERARVISHTDDKMQLTALAIADTRADILCLQEVENLATLHAFEYGYLYKMIGQGYRHKYLIEGNDSRGIDVGLMVRDETADGEPIEVVAHQSHAHLTFEMLDLHSPELAELGLEANERIFRRDCLEVDLKIGGRPITLFVVHFKSMGSPRDGLPGRTYTMPVRDAEARAVRHIIEQKFPDKPEKMRWMVCGDFNDYRKRLVVDGIHGQKPKFELMEETVCGFDGLVEGGFGENLVARREPEDQWTLYHTRGPEEQHLVQLDYLLASPALAVSNPTAVPEIIRSGQPYRTVFPPNQNVERYPRTGWDRPKASDHCPVAVTLNNV